MCIHFQAKTIAPVARKILSKAISDAAVAAKVIDFTLSKHDPRVGKDPEPLSAILAAAPSVPAQPFLDRLVPPLNPIKRDFVLEHALMIRNAGYFDMGKTPILALLSDSDPKSQYRAGMLVLLLSAPDDPLRKKAIELIKQGLRRPDDDPDVSGEGMAADLSKLGEAAKPLASELAKRAAGPGEMWTFLALKALGPDGVVGLPGAIAKLACRGECYSLSDAADLIASLGPKAVSAASALVAAARQHPYQRRSLIAALDAIGARLTKAQWQTVNALYRTDCAEAGSIPFFSLSRDDECGALASHLEAIAKRSGEQFRPVGWDIAP
jgi:hypothetical protein